MAVKKKAPLKLIHYRSQRLSKRINLDTIHPNLVKAVLGDYLVRRQPKKSLASVLISATAALALQKIVINPQEYTLSFMESLDDSVPEETVKKELHQIILKRQQHQLSIRILFTQLMHDIAVYLSFDDCANWYQAFPFMLNLASMHWVKSDKGLKDKVAYELGKSIWVGKNATRILQQEAYFTLFQRATRYPDHPWHTVTALVQKVAKFENCRQLLTVHQSNYKDIRKREMYECLKENQCFKACPGCLDKYIYALICVDIHEVIANTILTNKLMSYSSIVFAELIERFKLDLIRKVYRKKMD
jgi:hypothetical protein